MVAKVEAGRRRVDAIELTRFAASLDVSLAHFLDDRPMVMSRRSATLGEEINTTSDKDLLRVESALFAWWRDVNQLIDEGCLRMREPLIYGGAVRDSHQSRVVAKWVREKLCIGLDPIETLMSVCEQAGQYVLVTDIPGDGASLVEGGVAVAVIASSPDPGRRRATAAHELGHLVLGDEYSTEMGVASSRQERESIVDAFAAELLLPSEVLRSLEGGDLRKDLIRLAATYRTSWALAIRQAKHAEVISLSDARSLKSSNPTRAEFREAIGWVPQPDLGQVLVPPSYADAVMEALRSAKLTPGRAAELMHGEVGLDDLLVVVESELEP